MPCLPLSSKPSVSLVVTEVRNRGVGTSHKTREKADWLSSVSVLGKEYFASVAASVWMEILVLLTLRYQISQCQWGALCYNFVPTYTFTLNSLVDSEVQHKSVSRLCGM